MAANDQAVAYTELQDEAQRAAGWRKASGSWSSTQTGDFAAAVKSAQNWCYYPPVLPSDEGRGMNSPHIWSFMTSQPTTLQLRAPYATGTIAVTNGVVTLTSGTFPSWAASGDMWISSVRYSVNTRDSNTQVTLNDTSLTGVSGASYNLIQHYYALPSDFGSLVGDGFTYGRDYRSGQGALKRIPERTVRELDRDFGSTALYPCEYALSWIAPTSGGDDARQQVQFFPVTSTDIAVEYRYEIIPVELTGSGANIYHHGGPWFGELLKKATIAELLKKVRGHDSSSYQAAHYDRMEALASAVGYDRRTAAVETLGRPPSDDALTEDVLNDLRADQPWSTVSIDV